MGSSSSKVARTAASTARRQYPSTSSIPTNTTSTSNPPTTNAPPSFAPPAPAQGHPDLSQEPPSWSKSQHIELDGRDPQFESRLSQIGPVQPGSQTPSNQHQFPPSSSPNRQGQNIFPSTSPTTNPAILVTQARERIGKLWEEENEKLGRGSFQGRTLINASQIKEVLEMREHGMSAGDIEKRLRLRSGLVQRLGAGGVVANA